MMRHVLGVGLGFLMAQAALVQVAQAQDDDVPLIEVSGYIGGVTDYRDRGLSLSDQDPTVVGSVAFTHKSGFYAGTKAALIDDQFGRDVQAEFFAGYQYDAGDFVYDFSAELDSFFGDGENQYFPEFKASVSRDFGLIYVRSGFAYAPEGRWNTPGVDSLYWSLDAEIPVPTASEFTIITRYGYDFRQGRRDVADWAVGLSAFISDVELSLMYEGAALDQEIGDDAIVFGLRLFY